MNHQVTSFQGDFRIHIGLAVSDVSRCIKFYAAMFGEKPVKVRPGYAKFEPQDPSVNLSLIQVSSVLPANPEAHFGIQIKSSEQLAAMTDRLQSQGLALEFQDQVSCCYAVQDKIWVRDPDGNAWEVFLVTDDDSSSAMVHSQSGQIECCSTTCCENSDASQLPTAISAHHVT